jgi:WD40 repeat protein
MDNVITIYDTHNNFNKVLTIQPGICKNTWNLKKYFLVKSWKFDFNPIENELATGNYCIDIFDIDSAEKISVLQNDLKFIYSMLYLDPQTLAVGSTNGSINIYSLESLKITRKVEEHCLPVRALAIDSENKKLISCSDDLHINILDSQTFKVNLSLVGHKDIITAISVNNQYNVYASCSHDGSIKIWDIQQSKCVQTIHLPNPSLNEEGNNLWDLSFSNDGKYLLCGSDYGFHVLTFS